jgi:hypothetical protein
MEVCIDEAGRDDSPAHIDNFDGISIRYAVLDCGNAAAAHGNVHDATTVVFRVDDHSLLQEQIISHSMFPFYPIVRPKQPA